MLKQSGAAVVEGAIQNFLQMDTLYNQYATVELKPKFVTAQLQAFLVIRQVSTMSLLVNRILSSLLSLQFLCRPSLT